MADAAETGTQRDRDLTADRITCAIFGEQEQGTWVWQPPPGGGDFQWVNVDNTPSWIIEADGHPTRDEIYTTDQWNNIHRRHRMGPWTQMPGSPTDIAVGDRVWVVGTNDIPYYWVPERNEWQPVSGHVSRIAVNADGDPWSISSNGQIWVWCKGGNLSMVPECGP